tara:strand:+ start:17 stop:541 length:525 start_codon:yes stop_codon:yes gene_type:complete
MDQANSQSYDEFEGYWKNTEIIKMYEGPLPTFCDIKLPYVAIIPKESQNPNVVILGDIVIGASQIDLPKGYGDRKNIAPKEIYFKMRRDFYINKNAKMGRNPLTTGNLIEKCLKSINSIDGNEVGLIKISCEEGLVAGLRRYADNLMENSYEINSTELVEELVKEGILSIDWLL